MSAPTFRESVFRALVAYEAAVREEERARMKLQTAKEDLHALLDTAVPWSRAEGRVT